MKEIKGLLHTKLDDHSRWFVGVLKSNNTDDAMKRRCSEIIQECAELEPDFIAVIKLFVHDGASQYRIKKVQALLETIVFRGALCNHWYYTQQGLMPQSVMESYLEYVNRDSTTEIAKYLTIKSPGKKK